MMILQDQQINEIRNYLLANGLKIPLVLEDMQDHFCCIIEARLREGATFDAAFQEARTLMPPEDIREIQTDTIYFLTIKSKIMLVKGIFITAFLSVFSYVLGTILYKLLLLVSDGNPELAGLLRFVLQILSLVIFAFGFLPLLFRFGYKEFVARLQG